jgi:hypothetical protein
MINRITSFFSQQRKNVNLYFDVEKSESISIEITPDKTISQLYIENINKISIIRAKIYLNKKNNLPNNQRKEFCFVLINKNEPNIRVKLTNNIHPWFYIYYLKNSEYSLYYIPNDNYYYSLDNNEINCRLNNLNKNKSQNEPKDNKTLSDGTRVVNFVSPENKIIDGEIEKYSYSDKKFKNKFLYVDSNKLMYKDAASTYQKLFYIIINNKSISPYNESSYIHNSNGNIYETDNLWSVIPLSTIYSIDKNSLGDLESLGIDLKKFGERLLVIRTFNKEKVIFRAHNNYSREELFKVLGDIVEQAKIDKYLYQYNSEINEGTKTLYLSILKFIYKIISIKGIVVLKETRRIFFDYSDNKILGKIIEFCVEFKLNVIKKNTIKGYEQIKNLVEFLGYENFEEDTKFLDKEMFSEEIVEDKNRIIDKDYVLKYLMDEDTHTKLINIYQSIRRRSLSFKTFSNLSFKKKANSSSNINNIIIDSDVLNQLYKNIIKKVLSKEHKKIMRNNNKILNNLNKITAIQFCKHNNFNKNKMNVLCKKDNDKKMNIDIDVYSDLDEFL